MLVYFRCILVLTAVQSSGIRMHQRSDRRLQYIRATIGREVHLTRYHSPAEG